MDDMGKRLPPEQLYNPDPGLLLRQSKTKISRKKQ